MENKDLNLENKASRSIEEPSLEERLKEERREEERLHMLTKKSGDLPVIHTMEGDVYDNIRKENIDKIKILSGQMDTKGNVFEADNLIKRRRIMMISGIVTTLLLITACASYYFLIYKKPVVVEDVKVEAPRYTVLDVWNDPMSKSLFSYTSEATSTNDSIVIHINNFDSIYQTILSDESVFDGLARSKFKYFALGDFSDVSVKNIQMRVADGGSGALVYGYVGKDYLIVANSINRFLELHENLSKK